MAPSAADEAAFMSQLIQGLDDSFWNAVPSPDPSPVKTKPLARSLPRTPSKPSKSQHSSSTQPISQPLSQLSSTLFSTNEHDIASFLQGSETWDLDDTSFSPIKPTKKLPCTKVNNNPLYVPDPCTRCVVETLVEECIDNRWRKTVVAQIEPSEERVQVYLYDDWYQTDMRIDDIFNVLGSFSSPSSPSTEDPTRFISITSQSNLLVLHPDILLTATALSNAPQCRRKPLLSSLVRSTSDITPALVWGSMLHEVMQKCLLDHKWDDVFIDKCIDEAVLGGLGELVKLGLSEDIARREVRDRSRGMKVFAEKYLGEGPKPEAMLTNTRSGAYDAPSLLAITKLLDIEEDIWSPTYGLKGKLDATVQGIISDPVPPPSSSSYYAKSSATPERTLIHAPLPLELKTGRALAGMEHRAQTMLYTLLLSERYGADVKDGLLFYTQSEGGEVVRVPRGRNEIRGLIGVRNELAGYMWRRVRKAKRKEIKHEMDVDIEDALEEEEEPFLPPPIDDERACKRCYAQDTCFLFRKTHPNHSTNTKSNTKSAKSKAKSKMTFDPPIPAFLSDVFEAKMGHLTPSQTQFFRDWEHLLALEERDLVRFKRELWTLGAVERERRGRCFAGMVLVGEKRKKGMGVVEAGVDEEESGEWGKEGKIHRYTYSFARSNKWVSSPTSSPSSTLGSSSSAFSAISSWTSSPTSPSTRRMRTHHETHSQGQNLLNGHLNVGDAVTVSVEPLLALARGFIIELTPDQVVLGVDHVLDVDSIRTRLCRDQSHSKQHEGEEEEEVIFRIDKDELFGGMARVRNNLAQLFYADGDRRRLELVVDLRKPVFCDPSPPFSLGSSSSPSLSRTAWHSHLNSSQLAAMERVLSAQDYALVLGMPGTGKTSVIAALIQELVRRGKTVLLTSYTHSAVDTILMKVGGKDEDGGGFGILRLGNVDKVHSDIRKYTLNARRTATTVEQLEIQIMAPPVVATTCLSIDHPLFSRRKFDYCIVDEASQITLPTCLGPLRFADTFVLVGDHYQLPPLVKNPEARKGGLDVSLFRRLSDAHQEAVVDLRFQYRMNSDIMLLSNRLIYNDRLSCGNEEVARRCLSLADRKFLGRLHVGDDCGNDCWLEKLADESCKAVFVDTDALPAPDSRVGDLVQNNIEAELVRQFTETLLRCGVTESQIGIISLYRQQVKLLQHLLQERPGVEILTADKSQGRDKDCVIISLVRSNEGGHIGDLVKDWRRMNVSFTRARSKLVIFGSRKTLQREPLLAQFFGLMEEKGWIVQLPPGAHMAHARVFDVCSTPAKRGVEVEVGDAGGGGAGRRLGKENDVKEQDKEKEARPVKKIKVVKKADVGGAGVLKGRPILQDLVGNET